MAALIGKDKDVINQNILRSFGVDSTSTPKLSNDQRIALLSSASPLPKVEAVRLFGSDVVATVLNAPKPKPMKLILKLDHRSRRHARKTRFASVVDKSTRVQTVKIGQDDLEKMFRLKDANEAAMIFFENQESASSWLNRPHSFFDNRTAVDLLDTQFGAQKVMSVLNAMNTGGAL